MVERGLGPPVKIGNIGRYIIDFISYLVLFLVHLGLQITLLVLAAIIVLHPAILRSPDLVILIAGLAIVDILISKKL